jgi:hypothetical protein
MKKLIILPLIILVSCASHGDKKSEPFMVGVDEKIFKASLEVPNRSIANTDEDLTQEETSLKRLYFKALYTHYIELQNTKKVLSCPQFHHDKTDIDASVVRSNLPRRKKQKKIKTYLTQIKRELNQLCEDGESENYFKVENLSTYFVGHKDFHLKSESFKVLFKLPVFSAFVVKEKETFNWKNYELEFLKRVGVAGLENYVYILQSKSDNI